jgi:hypothetical protein
MITWFSGNNTFVELSATEEEYMAMSMNSFEAIWLCKLMATPMVTNLNKVITSDS